MGDDVYHPRGEGLEMGDDVDDVYYRRGRKPRGCEGPLRNTHTCSGHVTDKSWHQREFIDDGCRLGWM